MFPFKSLLKISSKHQPLKKWYYLIPPANSVVQNACKRHASKHKFYVRSNWYSNLFHEVENSHMFSIVTRTSPLLGVSVSHNDTLVSQEQFNSILEQNWRTSNAREIVNAFKILKPYCIDNKIPISDTRFDRLVDGLMDHCEKLTDDELLDLLKILVEYPSCENYTAHNFHDIWSCLDDMCCLRMQSWPVDQILLFANAWYELRLSRVCDYVHEVLERFVKKSDKLTKDQLVKIFFYFNICRRRPVDFEYEYAVQQKLNEMNVDEMAVVALGYFKTKSKIKLQSIMQGMIEEVVKNTETIHEISLGAIMKTLRKSGPVKLIPEIIDMLDKLHPEMDRFSELACLHVALILTSIQVLHENVLQKTSEKIAKHISIPEIIRLKDIERILNALTMYNFNPKTNPDIYTAAFNELHNPNRLEEIVRHPRALASYMNYLSMREIYSYEMLNKVLDKDYIIENFGKSPKMLPREILSLDVCVDIDCPDYKGNRLTPIIRHKAAKWCTEFTPSYNQYKKLTSGEKFFLEVLDTVKRVVKQDELIFVNHVLPHFVHSDIILCKFKNRFIEPVGFEKYNFGDVMVPQSGKNLKWFAIVVLNWNNTTRDTNLPLGHILMKERQLRKIGYSPIKVTLLIV